MRVRVVGPVPAAQVAGAAAWCAAHRITEHVVRAALAAKAPLDVHAMDELTLDVVVALPGGAYLVYDTT